jgi:hypothetical protein
VVRRLHAQHHVLLGLRAGGLLRRVLLGALGLVRGRVLHAARPVRRRLPLLGIVPRGGRTVVAGRGCGITPPAAAAGEGVLDGAYDGAQDAAASCRSCLTAASSLVAFSAVDCARSSWLFCREAMAGTDTGQLASSSCFFDRSLQLLIALFVQVVEQGGARHPIKRAARERW